LAERPRTEQGCVGGDTVCEASCTRGILLINATQGLSVEDKAVAALFDAMYRQIARLLWLARWRRGSVGPHHSIRQFVEFVWRLKGGSWQAVKDMVHLNAEIGFPTKIKPDPLQPAIATLWRTAESEPLGHELWREAYGNRTANPRSAAVLAVAAAEVGFKEFVAKLVPATAWLLENVPSPPLLKMLTKYLPELPVRLAPTGRKAHVPTAVRREIEEAIRLRNGLVHVGERQIDQARLRSILGAVRDLLYLLDVYSGQRWATEHISVATQKALNTEGARVQ